MTDPRVRVRGIYATGVTQLLLEEGRAVVDPSEPVAARFDAQFSDGVPTVSIESTADRMGMTISGDATAVEPVRRAVEGLSTDTFSWQADLPRGTVRPGVIEQTEESGAVVRTGGTTGFLPYSRSDRYVSEGDRVAVQVIDPEPPWSPDRRPVLGTRPHAFGSYLTLVKHDERDPIEASSRELRGMVDLLDPQLPEGWSVRVSDTAADVELATLGADLERASERRASVVSAMEIAADPDEPGGVFAPEATIFCRIGRGGRFELDERRASVTTTIDGHHRLKAAGRGGGSAVDFLEHLDISIPFSAPAVLDSFGPSTGDRVRINHVKPSGETIVLGRGTVVDRPDPASVAVRRELTAGGTLDALDVPIESGDTAETTYVEGERWAPTVYRDVDGNRKGTYLNIGTPLEVFPGAIAYVDLYVDVVKDAEGTVAVVDEDELAAAVDRGEVTEVLARKARQLAKTLQRSAAPAG